MKDHDELQCSSVKHKNKGDFNLIRDPELLVRTRGRRAAIRTYTALN